jgi:hypothetical protein
LETSDSKRLSKNLLQRWSALSSLLLASFPSSFYFPSSRKSILTGTPSLHGIEQPIYLFFSVNGSGHFAGMAQMITDVDYNTTSTVWNQDKWKGIFRVKWIYVRDVPVRVSLSLSLSLFLSLPFFPSSNRP